MLPITRRGEPVALLLHAPPTTAAAALVRSVVQTGALAIEIARLRVELRRQLAEVEASRARIVVATHEERRRIERDLHDGAQQRLVSIGLALRHAQHQLGVAGAAAPATGVADKVSRTLDGAVAQVATTIDELRELAHGLPPAQLDEGLGPAFHELARQAMVPVHVEAPADRFDRRVEAAAYFVGCEGLTNAVKHARARRITLSAQAHAGSLVVLVSDDGVGGARLDRGSGLRGLADRVAALGGTLRIDSDAGGGTVLTARLPYDRGPGLGSSERRAEEAGPVASPAGALHAAGAGEDAGRTSAAREGGRCES
jgi:signal transduction histidine kinase